MNVSARAKQVGCGCNSYARDYASQPRPDAGRAARILLAPASARSPANRGRPAAEALSLAWSEAARADADRITTPHTRTACLGVR